MISINTIIIPPAPAFVVLATNSCKNAAGKLAIIPTVINKEIPLPIPLSVIRSPNHIAKIVPAVKIILMIPRKLAISVTKNASGPKPN